MKQSKLFGKTSRENPADEVSVNAKLLTRGGFVDKLTAGIYSFLPLGLRVIKRIEQIIREEMNAAGGQELCMPALQPRENWERTGRWKGFDVLFQLKGSGDKEYALGPSHEEVITPLVKKFVSSYRDLPLALYQFQTKFRNELRTKSGLLRGREFLMKDMYSFHRNEQDLDRYYQTILAAYKKIFTRMELNALMTEAGGGTFSKYSHEFQVPTPGGEDIIMTCESGDFAQNREIAKIKAGEMCPKCHTNIRAERTIEVGNIFPLKTKFADAFNLAYKDERGENQPVLMGCYGIGLGRTMGAIVEVHHDQHGIIWPKAVAPYVIHLVLLQSDKNLLAAADKIYASLQKADFEVLYDERISASIGEKLADADLLGIPIRIVVSEKTIEKESAEVKKRSEKKVKIVKIKDLAKHLASDN